MSPERVAATWVFRGLSDLFFGFDSFDVAFEDNARFSEIMGLEKFLKAVLLYQARVDYEFLPEEEARRKINKLAMDFGHRFEFMLNRLSASGLNDIERIKQDGYDGYEGQKLVHAVERGYMETRYPVPVPVSNSFPIGTTGFTHDPLSSSGLPKFIYALCNACYFELTRSIDFTDMLSQFQKTFQHRESLARFNTSFWEVRCKR